MHLYEGFFGKLATPGGSSAQLVRLLKGFIVDIADRFERTKGATAHNDWKDKVSEIIATLDRNQPFDDLPLAERTAILDAMQIAALADPAAMKRKLEEIAQLLRLRVDELNTLRGWNRWSVPLAIAGVVLTVVFGWLSLKTI